MEEKLSPKTKTPPIPSEPVNPASQIGTTPPSTPDLTPPASPLPPIDPPDKSPIPSEPVNPASDIASSPPPPPAPPIIMDKPSKQKPKLLLPILLLAALATAAFFGYKYWQVTNTTTPEPYPLETPSPTPDPTTDWEAYTNEELSFKYPQSWTMQNISQSDKTIHLISPQNEELILLTLPEVYGMPCHIEISNNNIQLGNISATQTFFKYSDEGECGGQNTSKLETWVSFKAMDNTQTLQFIYNSDNKEQSLQILNQILSTFKITESANPTADWETYTSTELGISFKHPSNLVISKNNYNSSSYYSVIDTEQKTVGEGSAVISPIEFSLDLNKDPIEVAVNTSQSGYTPQTLNITTIISSGKVGITIISGTRAEGWLGGEQASVAYLENGNQQAIAFNYFGHFLNKSNIITEDVFNQILSSIELLN